MEKTITQIGRYEISRQLADTAVASVYDAFDPVERKSVAIRIPRTTQTHVSGELLSFRHPGLMTVLGYEDNQGEPFLVLEPFDGAPFDSRLPAGRKMEPAETIALLRQLAGALDYAHSHGAIHGSLHPSAILWNDRREVKVLDLGPAAGLPAKVPADQLLRAVHFLSPECIRDCAMDGRSDQFSLAVLAHRMLTGELPFPGTPLGVMFRIAYQGLERDAIRHLPAAAQTVFQRSLSKSPGERYSSCTEMVEKLEGALIQKPLAATRLADASQFAAVAPRGAPPAARPQTAPPRSREALKYFGVTFAACALLLVAIVYLLLPKQPKPVPAAVPPAAQVQSPPPVAAAPVPKPPVKPKSRTSARKAEPEVELKPVEPKIIRP